MEHSPQLSFNGTREVIILVPGKEPEWYLVYKARQRQQRRCEVVRRSLLRLQCRDTGLRGASGPLVRPKAPPAAKESAADRVLTPTEKARLLAALRERIRERDRDFYRKPAGVRD